MEQRAIHARPTVHRHRARPARPREVRQAARRLLRRGIRERHARPAQRARHRAGHGGRAFARRRRRDAVRLPVPAVGGPADSGRRGRGDQRRQLRASDRLPSDGHRGARGAAAAAGAARGAGGGTRRRTRDRQDRTGPRPARDAADPQGSTRADRILGVRAHAAGGRGLARAGGHHARPMLFDGIRSSAIDLGFARFGDPGQPRATRACRDARLAAGDLRRVRALPVPRRPRPLRRDRRTVHRLHRTGHLRPGPAARSAAQRHQRKQRSPDRSIPGSRCSTRWAPTNAAPPELRSSATS